MEENKELEATGDSGDLLSWDFSDSDNESFKGFDIIDARQYLREADSAILFNPIQTSTPVSKHVNKTRELPRGNRDSDTDIESVISGELDNPDSQVPTLPNSSTELSLDDHIDGDKVSNSSDDSEISGELVDSIFFQVPKKLKLLRDKDKRSRAGSESSLEGELCAPNFPPMPNPSTDDVVQDTTEEDKKGEGNSDTEGEADSSLNTTTTTKGKRRSTIKSPDQLVDEKCCTQQCLKMFKVHQLEKARDRFCREHPTYAAQRKMILNWLESNQPEAGTFTFSISGIPVCWLAWTGTLGITKRRFQNLKADFLGGRRSAEHGSFANIPYADHTDNVLRYLEAYFTETCDYMPNSSNWHLSSTTTKGDVYLELKANMQAEGIAVCTEAYFRLIWNRHFPHVKIPKDNRFGKCDDCATIKEHLRNTPDPLERAEIFKRRKRHIDFVRRERSSYLNRASSAHHEPHKFLSIAVDGMDQNKTELPFTRWRHCSLDKSWRLKIHLVGAMVHGRHPIVYLDYQQHSHDSNMTINIILQTLWVQRDLLPSILYVQLDNTYKENKNQYLFAMLAYLVETRVFEKIEVSFLPVGHTHIDVDQLFSRVSVAIRRYGAKTYQDLLKLIRTCHTQTQGETTQEGATPQYARIENIYAVREWLKPHAVEIHRSREFHHFRITRNEEGKSIIDYKPWCGSGTWDREQWEPLGPVLLSEPTGVPDIIKPNFKEVDFGRLEKMVEKCKGKGIFNEDDEHLWKEFLEQEKSCAECYENIEEIHYSDKNHKDNLAYIASTDTRWIVDDLRERQLPGEKACPNLNEALKVSEAYERGEGLLPMYTGRYVAPKEKQSQVIPNQNITDIEKGMLVALDFDGYRERPLIAEVRDILSDTIVVAWYGGTWTTKWTLARKREGRQWLDWTEEVPKDCVVLFDFTLTNGGKLRSHTVRHLKECYYASSDDNDAAEP